MTLDVALIGLPWSVAERPSAALGALTAYLRMHEPELRVAQRYEYVTVAERIGFELYADIAAFAYQVGESLYASILYPERRVTVVESVSAFELRDPRLAPRSTTVFEVDPLIDQLDAHLDELVNQIAGRFSLVGMTTSFGQLFANLAFARRLKERAPETKVVLGGSSISSVVGPSVLREFPFVDFIVQGEGERPLLALVRALMEGGEDASRFDSIEGLLTQGNVDVLPAGARLSEVKKMDELPIPDFADYVRVAEEKGIPWLVPVEGSRGCWWDRAKETNDVKQTCYFCNLNVQWSGYREKTVARIVDEVATQAKRYSMTSLFFLDNIIRHKGIEELAEGLRGIGMDLDFFYEMRANVRPAQLLALWDAGVTRVQFGIEALSTSLLKRMGKGTTAIQNLEALKTSYELGITHGGNLIVDFPLSTEQEVLETMTAIQDHAWSYEPLTISRFGLGVGSTVDTLWEQFKIANVRNSDSMRAALPPEVWERLRLLDLSYDQIGETASWGPVRELVGTWKEWTTKHKDRPRPFVYQDGGTFLRIRDWRSKGRCRDFVLRGIMRDVYLFCTEIRSKRRIIDEFVPNDSAREAKLFAALDKLAASKLVYIEGGKYLSLAPASSPQAAARRIRALAKKEASRREHQKAEPRGRRLPVVAAAVPEPRVAGSDLVS